MPAAGGGGSAGRRGREQGDRTRVRFLGRGQGPVCKNGRRRGVGEEGEKGEVGSWPAGLGFAAGWAGVGRLALVGWPALAKPIFLFFCFSYLQKLLGAIKKMFYASNEPQNFNGK